MRTYPSTRLGAHASNPRIEFSWQKGALGQAIESGAHAAANGWNHMQATQQGNILAGRGACDQQWRAVHMRESPTCSTLTGSTMRSHAVANSSSESWSSGRKHLSIRLSLRCSCEKKRSRCLCQDADAHSGLEVPPDCSLTGLLRSGY